jgi:large subunit ribosomal protein L4
MKIAVLNQNGEKVKDLELNEIFEKKVSEASLALYINYLRNSMRDAVANSKDRSEVAGTGKKPYKQKGTGRARQGSTQSPLHVGGGVTFGPSNEQNFHTRINKKTKRNVIVGIIAQKIQEDKVIVIDTLALPEAKTKEAITILNNIKADGKISLIFGKEDNNTDKSFRNLAGVTSMFSEKLNIIKILSSNKLIFSVDSLKKIEEIYSK